jgi:hypothetical protein
MATASTSTNWRIPKSSSSNSLEWRTETKKPAPATLVVTPIASLKKVAYYAKAVAPKKAAPKKPYKKPITKEQFWRPVTWVIPFYRCQACKEVMSRKEPHKTPQFIYSCKHITCARCISKSFFVELNPLCPVDGCNISVNPRCSTPTPSINILPLQLPVDTFDNIIINNSPINEDIFPIELDDLKTALDDIFQQENTFIPPEDAPYTMSSETYEEPFDSSCYDEYYSQFDSATNEEEKEEEEVEEYYSNNCCGISSCTGECGVLSCGCINICRNYRHRSDYNDHRYCYE